MTLTSPPIAVAPFDKGKLAAGISASATTITVSPIYKTVNGVRTKQGFNTTSGIAIISLGDFTERISFESSSVDATTKVTTLSTCVRGLSATSTTASFSGGTGRAWPKGAKIAVVADASYFQSGVFTNVANTFSALQTMSAGLTLSGTTATITLPTLTTAQRDLLTPAEGMLIKNSTTGTIQSYTGGAWASVGTDATANASTTVAGKIEIATAAERAAATATGGTGAVLVPSNDALVKTSSGASDENKIPVLGASGTLPIGMIATGTPTGSKFVRDDGTLQAPTITHYHQLLSANTADSSAAGTSTNAEAEFDVSYAIPTTAWVVGMPLRVTAVVRFVATNSETVLLRLKIGTTTLASKTYTNATAGVRAATVIVQYYIVPLVVSSSGTYTHFGWFINSISNSSTDFVGASQVDELEGFDKNAGGTSTTITSQTESADMTTTNTLKMSVDFGSSSSDNAARLQRLIVEKMSSTAF